MQELQSLEPWAQALHRQAARGPQVAGRQAPHPREAGPPALQSGHPLAPAGQKPEASPPFPAPPAVRAPSGFPAATPDLSATRGGLPAVAESLEFVSCSTSSQPVLLVCAAYRSLLSACCSFLSSFSLSSCFRSSSPRTASAEFAACSVPVRKSSSTFTFAAAGFGCASSRTPAAAFGSAFFPSDRFASLSNRFASFQIGVGVPFRSEFRLVSDW